MSWLAPLELPARLLGCAPEALATALLASVLCALIGTLVVLRRLVALGGGVAHASFGGIGLALAAGLAPRWGAVAVAVAVAAVLTALGRERSDRQDAVIGVLWAVGMAIGMWLLAGAHAGDVDGYLFGDVARVARGDLAALALLDLAVVAVFALRGRELVAVAFDAEHARIQGLPVGAFSFLLLLLVALSVVALLALAGVVLAIALLAIPPLVALRLCRGLGAAMAAAGGVGLAMSVGGLALAGATARPAGPAIVLVGAALLALSRLAPRRRLRSR
jgi:zinc transport system permease protein